MGRAWITAVGGFVVLAGCGTLLDIQPEPNLPSDDGGVPVGDGPVGDGDALANDGDSGDAGTPCPATAPCVLALAQGLKNLGSIAVANNNVYFTRRGVSGEILQVPTGGGAVTSFVANLNLPASLFATPTALYWVGEGDNTVGWRIFVTPSAEVSANGATTPAAQIAASAGGTFWTVPGTIGGGNGQVRVAAAGIDGGESIAGLLNLPTAITVDSRYVYYATKTGGPDGHIVRIGYGGAPIDTASPMFHDVNAMTVSESGVMAVTSLGGVWRASTVPDGDFRDTWGEITSASITNGVGIVVDDARAKLYVITGDGNLQVISDVKPPILSTLVAVSGCQQGRALAQDASHVYLACKDMIVRIAK